MSFDKLNHQNMTTKYNIDQFGSYVCSKLWIALNWNVCLLKFVIGELYQIGVSLYESTLHTMHPKQQTWYKLIKTDVFLEGVKQQAGFPVGSPQIPGKVHSTWPLIFPTFAGMPFYVFSPCTKFRTEESSPKLRIKKSLKSRNFEIWTSLIYFPGMVLNYRAFWTFEWKSTVHN